MMAIEMLGLQEGQMVYWQSEQTGARALTQVQASVPQATRPMTGTVASTGPGYVVINYQRGLWQQYNFADYPDGIPELHLSRDLLAAAVTASGARPPRYTGLPGKPS